MAAMRCPTFIGRREELRVLDNAVRMAATGRGSWITITGGAGDAPPGVVLEDLHWADVDTLTVCDYVIDHVESVGVVMLATARDSEAPAESRDLFARATVVALGPLSPTEIASMADACVGGVCPPDDVAQVQRSSGGLPLLVEDLLGETSRFDDLISRRVRDLPIEAQQVVIAAALIGERFAPADVAAALAISPTAVGAQLATAADAQLVVAEDDSAEVTFRHARTRDVALAARPEIAAGRRSALGARLDESGS